MTTAPYIDMFQQLRELNRAFLGLLQARARQQQGCLGLPLSLRPALRSASPALLDVVAEFPRALFRVRLESRPPTVAQEGGSVDHAFNLSILFAARQACRQNAYQARLMFMLETKEIEWFVKCSLPQLQAAATSPALVFCALAERHWFWQGLLTPARADSRRQVALMALQPVVSRTWSTRRPPRAAI